MVSGGKYFTLLSHDKLEFNHFLMEAHVCGAAGGWWGRLVVLDRDITTFGIPVNTQMRVTPSVSEQ